MYRSHVEYVPLMAQMSSRYFDVGDENDEMELVATNYSSAVDHPDEFDNFSDEDHPRNAPRPSCKRLFHRIMYFDICEVLTW